MGRTEKSDLAASHPEVVARLQKLAEKARVELGDELTGRKGSEKRPVGKIEGAAAYPERFPCL